MRRAPHDLEANNRQREGFHGIQSSGRDSDREDPERARSAPRFRCVPVAVLPVPPPDPGSAPPGPPRTSSSQSIAGAIQTSAPINPGNSGGPLLDSAGRPIGMNAAILSPSGAFAGIGFAIPVDEINQIVPQLIAHGKVVRPRLGVQVAPEQVARQPGVEEGAPIIKVVPNSAAARAGLRGTERSKSGHIHLGDAIVAADGQDIANGKQPSAAVQQHKVGDTLTLTIIRDDKRQDVKVTLQGGE
jgi:S1-C subfamily serine protease